MLRRLKYTTTFERQAFETGIDKYADHAK